MQEEEADLLVRRFRPLGLSPGRFSQSKRECTSPVVHAQHRRPGPRPRPRPRQSTKAKAAELHRAGRMMRRTRVCRHRQWRCCWQRQPYPSVLAHSSTDQSHHQAWRVRVHERRQRKQRSWRWCARAGVIGRSKRARARAHRRAGGAAGAGRGALSSVHDAAQEGRSWCAQAQAVQPSLAEAHRPRRDHFAVVESFSLKSWLGERRALPVMVCSHTPVTEWGWSHARRRRR